MALSDVVAAKKAEDGKRLKDAEAAVEAACASGADVVEVEVPWDLADALCAWVEGQGARCAIVRGMRGVPYSRFADLVINLKLAPRPVVVPEPENN